MPQYSNMNTFHTSHESHVAVEHHRTLEVYRLEYLKTSRMLQYLNMNTFHTSHESRVPVGRTKRDLACQLCSVLIPSPPLYHKLCEGLLFFGFKRNFLHCCALCSDASACSRTKTLKRLFLRAFSRGSWRVTSQNLLERGPQPSSCIVTGKIFCILCLDSPLFGLNYLR